MHPLLARQLRRHLPAGEDVPASWEALLQAVSATYAQADEDMRSVERSLAVVSHEMQERFERLEAQKAAQAALAADKARADETALLASVQLAAMRAVAPEAVLPGALYVIAEQVGAIAARLLLHHDRAWWIGHRWLSGEATASAVDWTVQLAESAAGGGAAMDDTPGNVPEGCSCERLVVDGPLADQGRLEFLFAGENPGRLTRELSGVIGRQLSFALRERRTERALDAQVALLRAIAHGTPDALTAKDLDGRYLLCNPAAERLIGRPEGEVIGRTDADLFDPETAAVMAAEDQAVVERGVPTSVERKWRVGDSGETRHLQLRKLPLRDSQRAVIGVAVIAIDVTDRLAMETRLHHAQKMAALGLMAGGVAHDFNNLLTVISGNASFLAGDALTPSARRDCVQEIRAAADRAAGIVRHLLTFARGRVTRPVLLELAALLREREPMLRRVLGERSELVLSLGDRPLAVRVDASILDQVLLNLLLNARQALPDGGRVHLELDSRTVDATDAEPLAVLPGRYVALHVTDNGVGMDEETQRRVFEPFFTTRPQGEGSGLGLSFVYGAVSQAGGATRVESAIGRGSTFTILLPLVDAEVPSAAATGGARGATPEAPMRPVTVPVAAGGGTILLVEDDPAVRSVARQVLAREGYRVLEARHGEEALRRAHDAGADGIDILVSDVMMPGMGGGALAQALRATRPNLPVLFVSGYTDDEVARTRLEASGYHFLPKPFSVDALLQAVRATLTTGAPHRVSGE